MVQELANPLLVSTGLFKFFFGDFAVCNDLVTLPVGGSSVSVVFVEIFYCWANRSRQSCSCFFSVSAIRGDTAF